MFGIDFEALLLIAVLAFILFGPQKLPEYAAKLGCLIAKLKEASADLTQQCQTSFPNILEQSAAKPAVTDPYHYQTPDTSAELPETPAPPVAGETGSELTAQAGAYERPCPLCAHLVSHDFTFCPKCGHQIKPHENISNLLIPEATIKTGKPS